MSLVEELKSEISKILSVEDVRKELEQLRSNLDYEIKRIHERIDALSKDLDRETQDRRDAISEALNKPQ